MFYNYNNKIRLFATEQSRLFANRQLASSPPNSRGSSPIVNLPVREQAKNSINSRLTRVSPPQKARHEKQRTRE